MTLCRDNCNFSRRKIGANEVTPAAAAQQRGKKTLSPSLTTA